MATSHLDVKDPNRKLPSRTTDLHALVGVDLYVYSLYRHPLRGDKVFDPNDPQRDEEWEWGNKHYLLNTRDRSNRIKTENIRPSEHPWKDTEKMPYISNRNIFK